MESILTKELKVNKAICRTMGVLVFVILTGLGAFVRIPLWFTPVPLTLQTFFVLLSGAMLGANLGALSQIIYIILGLSGISVFANAGSGFIYLLGPTGGYVFGFVLASFLIGKLTSSEQRLGLFSIFLAMCLADMVILFSGLFWLKFLFGLNLNRAIWLGLFPFLPLDLIKIVFASLIFFNGYARIKKIF